MPEPTGEELLARIAEVEAVVEGRKAVALTFKASGKGGVSVYGLARFPVTLYYEQWVRLLEHADELKAFLKENKGKLKLPAKESGRRHVARRVRRGARGRIVVTRRSMRC